MRSRHILERMKSSFSFLREIFRRDITSADLSLSGLDFAHICSTFEKELE